MNKNELNKRLNNGEQWGFIKETDNYDYLGWILINKEQPIIIYEKKAYSSGEQYIRLVKKEEARRKNPYHIRIVELLRDVHEKGVYETQEDYRQNDNHYFSTLDEVEKYIVELGYTFEDIKGRREIDAP